MRKLTEDEIDDLLSKVDNEGFDYCFTSYSNWKELKDTEIYPLIQNYQNAYKKLEKYLDSLDSENNYE